MIARLLLAGHLLLASASQDKYLRVWRIQPQSAPQKAAPSTSGPNTTSSNGDLASDIARYFTQNAQMITSFNGTIHAHSYGLICRHAATCHCTSL